MTEEIPEELIEAGRSYEALFVSALFEPWTRHLVSAAGIQAGSHVLDVACGTGVLARRALAVVGTAGRVAGADPAPGMLAVARELEGAIDWRRCPAEALDFDDGSFDSVVSQFGMMFFENRQRSAEEMFRVLTPGGSLALAVWRSVEHNPAYAALISVLEAQAGSAAADALRLPFGLGDAAAVTSVLEASGFGALSVDARTATAAFPGIRQMVEAELRGWLPLCGVTLAEDQIDNVLVEAETALGRYAEASGKVVFPTAAHIFRARKT